MAEYAAAAELAAANALWGPAHQAMLHALELGLKAAIASTGERPWRNHEAGQFGDLFRNRVPKEVLRQLNRQLARYHDSRYPGARRPGEEETESALEFVRRFLDETLPPLIDAK